MKRIADIGLFKNLSIFAIASMTILFFIGGPDYHSSRSFKALWNLGHIVYYAVLPLLLISSPPFRKLRYGTQAALILVLALVLGALVEWLQYGFHRTPDMGDMFRNLIGAGIAICFFLPGSKAVPAIRRRVARLLFTGLAIAQLNPVGIAVVDEYRACRDFPILSDFQSPWQIQRWTGGASITRVADIGDQGNWAMRVDLTTQQYSGCALTYFPGDWQGYHGFQFRVYNPSETPIDITCRIHDRMHTRGVQRYHDRFNRTYSLANGWNTIVIPLADVQQAPATRRMDIGQIYSVGIFASRLPSPRTIYIDDVKLK